MVIWPSLSQEPTVVYSLSIRGNRILGLVMAGVSKRRLMFFRWRADNAAILIQRETVLRLKSR